MRIIGNGFLAGHLAGLADAHPHAVVIAAGVSSTWVTDEAALGRERDLVRTAAERNAAEGTTLVFLSTASHAMYGDRETPARETEPVDPSSAYGRHKLGLERIVRDTAERWLILRLGHVVGHGSPKHQLFPGLAAQIGTGEITVYRGVHRDVIDVADVVWALDGLLSAGANNAVFNVASGFPQPIESVVAGIQRRMGLSPVWTERHVDRVRCLVSTEALNSVLPFAERIGPGESYLDSVLDRYVPELVAG